MSTPTVVFTALGGNRHPCAASWSPYGTLAFGAGRYIALWNPDDPLLPGITATLKGHTGHVNVVRFLPPGHDDGETILSGSDDKTVRVWTKPAGIADFTLAATVETHTGSINDIAVCTQQPNLFATASTDGTVGVFSLGSAVGAVQHQQTLHTKSTKLSFYALSLALAALPGRAGGAGILLAIGGSMNHIQLYTAPSARAPFQLQATLQGHENWVRALDFTYEDRGSGAVAGSDVLLASACQDRYIRLWRVHAGDTLPASSKSRTFQLATRLSNKAHMLRHSDGGVWSVTFEALLMGHEDWIYKAAWRPDTLRLQLLSCSADNSIVVWGQEELGGTWNPLSRFGEISALKGASTATGSAGGIWNTLWSPDGSAVAALTKSGSWCIWRYNMHDGRWNPAPGISGHTKVVSGISWAPDGGYLLSTSLDQTTRLFAKWSFMCGGVDSWHEFSRPQIHGYDINCLTSVTSNRFVSGADEKLLRVFGEPKSVGAALQRLCGLQKDLHKDDLLATAGLPVLGLSNKLIEPDAKPNSTDGAADDDKPPPPEQLPGSMPPIENQLSRSTLWPEIEKLYGHGYEISALAAAPNSGLIATACKASTLEHAVIRLFDGDRCWEELRPALQAHALTVTTLRFSQCGKRLLSVGRDRAFGVFECGGRDGKTWALREKKEKAHTKMIYDCGWMPGDRAVFVTVSRDKSLKIWEENEGAWVTVATVKFEMPITAADIMGDILDGRCWMMIGLEDGSLEAYSVETGKWGDIERKFVIDASITPTLPITKITWRPYASSAHTNREVAVASEDSSVRVYRLSLV